MATTSESNLFVYNVSYSAGGTSLTLGTEVTILNSGAGHQSDTITISSSDPVLSLGSGDVFDTTLGVNNLYIGTVTLPGRVTGFLVKDTDNGKYYIFTTAQLHDVHLGTTLTVHPSTGAHDPNPYNWSLGGAHTPPQGPTAYCFMAGTAIRTPSGEVAVEALNIGDPVTLADGSAAPVAWIGRQTVTPRFADPLRSFPIRILAGALADRLPARDLLLSPDHALLLDGVLIQAGALVNGVSIRRETRLPEKFTYYHVETKSHALILAENVPAETFVDNVDRLAFDNWAEHAALYGDAAEIPEMDYPRAKAARQVPMATRARLQARAAALSGTARAAA